MDAAYAEWEGTVTMSKPILTASMADQVRYENCTHPLDAI